MIALKGEDVRIHDSAVINNPDLVIAGDHVTIDHFTYISVELIMGNWIHIAPFVSIIGGKGSTLIMGDFTGISAGGRVICASDDFVNSLCNPMVPAGFRSVKKGNIVMEDFSMVGTNAIVFPGVRMAIGSVLGANSLLIQDTEPWGVYVGSPAKLIKHRNKKLILKNAKNLGYELGKN